MKNIVTSTNGSVSSLKVVSPVPLEELQSNGGFSIEHANLTSNSIVKDSYPWLYHNSDVVYVTTTVLPIDQIDDGSELERFTAQSPRVSKNSQYSSIRSDIKGHGYSLTELPVSVRIITDDNGVKSYQCIDGRTRLEILESLGVENVVVDVFEIKEEVDFIRLTQIYNRYRKPFGEGSVNDIGQTIIHLNEANAFPKSVLGYAGGLGKTFCRDDQELSIRMAAAGKVIHNECVKLSNNKLTADQISQVTGNVLNSFGSDKTILIRKFNNGGRITQFLSENFHLTSDDTSLYIPFSGSELAIGKMIESIMNKREWLDKSKHRRVCYILYAGKPNPTDPEGSWRKATVDDMKSKWDDAMSYLDFEHKDRVILLGAIPQIRSLNNEFPMDKLHYF